MTDDKLVIEEGQNPDEETLKILESLAAEEKAQNPEKETKPEAKPEEKKEPEKEPEKVVEVKDKELELDLDDEKVEPRKQGESPVPVWQLRKLEKQFSKELSAITEKLDKIAASGGNVTKDVEKKVEAIDDKIKSFAEENGWDVETVKKLRDVLVPEMPAIPEEVLELASQAKKEKEARAQIDMFKTELSDALSILPPEFADVNQNKLKDLAFGKDTGFRANGQPKSLVEIMMANRDTLLPNKPAKSFESSKGGSASGDTGPDLTIEQPADVIAQMSAKQFEVYSENMAKGSKMTILRDGRVVRD